MPSTAVLRAFSMVEPLESRIAPATLTWDGSASNLWNNAANWTPAQVPASGDALVFPDNAQNLINTNNLSGLILQSLRFTGPNYVIGGNGISLAGGITADINGGIFLDDGPQFNASITLTGDQTFDNSGTGLVVTGRETLTLGGPIVLNGHTLTFGGTTALRVENNINGTGALVKSGVGTLFMAAPSSNYVGTTTVNQGTLQVESNAALGAAGLASLTQIAAGATLRFQNDVNIGESIVATGAGVNGAGALVNGSGSSNTLSGSLILVGTTTLGLPDADDAFTLSGTLQTTIDDTAVGPDFFPLVITGEGTLGLSGELIIVGDFKAPKGTQIKVVDNTGTGLIIGTFAGKLNGDTFEVTDRTFTINYAPQTGGDVRLTAGLATFRWSGAGPNANWTTAANWTTNQAPFAGAKLVFQNGGAQKSNTNDLVAGTSFHSLVFDDGAYTISGNAIQLTAGASVTGNAGQGIKLDIALTLAGNVTFLSGPQIGLSFQRPIDLNGLELAIDGPRRMIFEGTIFGDGRITKRGSGDASFRAANTYTGSTTILAGSISLGGEGTLGATGIGNETIVAEEGNLSVTATTPLAENLVIKGAGGGVGALRLLDAGSLTGRVTLAGNATLKVSGSNGNPDALALGGTLRLDLNGTAPGTDFEVLSIVVPSGDTLTLTSALELSGSFLPAPGASFKIVDVSGGGTLAGTFAGLGEGAIFTQGIRRFGISYVGGDGNDVVLTAIAPTTDFVVSASGKTATFTDLDGDRVTVTTTRGKFAADGSNFIFGIFGDNRQQLQKLTLDPSFSGANLTITAKRTANGGNGSVNVGFIDALNVDLGAVRIEGDLAGLSAGTQQVDAKVPGLKALTVNSLGVLGLSTQNPNLSSQAGVLVQGGIPKVVIAGDMRAGLQAQGFTDGKIGSIKVGGSVTNGVDPTIIKADVNLGSLTVRRDVRSDLSGSIQIISAADIGTIEIGGNLQGFSSSRPILISAFGQLAAPSKGMDAAIKSFKVRGNVELMQMFVGLSINGISADASVGSVQVGGDWMASSILAGVNVGADSTFGTDDDVKLTGTRDNPALFSTIGSIVIKGQAYGTEGSITDMFGIVAERIGKATIGRVPLAFTNDNTPEGFFAASTGLGKTGLDADFTVREIGSVTPNFGPELQINLSISGDGRTATYIDVDGDLVTIKTSNGQFTAGNFNLIQAATGGGYLLGINVGQDFAGANLAITARPGPRGGNGFVNVDQIETNASGSQIDLGSVSIAGDLGRIFVGDSDLSTPGLKSLTAQSLGLRASLTDADGRSIVTGDLVKLSLAGDHRGELNITRRLGSGVIGGSVVGGSVDFSGSFNVTSGIGALKIAGDLRSGTGALSGSIMVSQGAMGSLQIGGDVVGTKTDGVRIAAFGQLAAPAKGPDLAIKSLTVGGNMEHAVVLAGGFGTFNADAGMGTVLVKNHWIASFMLAGALAGPDGLVATTDDRKATGFGARDNPGIFSQIASITIKGQAFGTPEGGDHFGMTAERIGKAVIGKVTLPFKAGARSAGDSFSAASTTPGGDGSLFDFTIRELV